MTMTFFILSHSALSLTKVNTYALMYVWEGSDASLKPVLLAAHQGVSAHQALSRD